MSDAMLAPSDPAPAPLSHDEMAEFLEDAPAKKPPLSKEEMAEFLKD